MEEIRRSHDNVLLLDAGDQFQGTIWFSYYQGEVAAHFMERLGYDAMVRTTRGSTSSPRSWRLETRDTKLTYADAYNVFRQQR